MKSEMLVNVGREISGIGAARFQIRRISLLKTLPSPNNFGETGNFRVDVLFGPALFILCPISSLLCIPGYL
jgi:hypothetical protein